MQEEYSLLVNRVELAGKWSVHLPEIFRMRDEEDGIVLWRPGFTAWVNVFDNEIEESIELRKAFVVGTADPDKSDPRESSDNGIVRYSYRLKEESDDQRAAALYAFSFAENGHLQIAFYFDSEDDATIAYQIHESANQQPPAVVDQEIFSLACLASNRILKDGQQVGYMLREQPNHENDSGWRFLAGDETQQYVDMPENMQVCPLAFVVQPNPEIIDYISSETGVRMIRQGGKFIKA